MKFKLLITLLTLSTTITHAHFYRYVLWGYKNEQGESRFVHLLSDNHYPGKINRQQRNELISSVFHRYGIKDSLFIVEGGTHTKFYNGPLLMCKLRKILWPLENLLYPPGVLANLEEECRKKGFNVQDVECSKNDTLLGHLGYTGNFTPDACTDHATFSKLLEIHLKNLDALDHKIINGYKCCFDRGYGYRRYFLRRQFKNGFETSYHDDLIIPAKDVLNEVLKNSKQGKNTNLNGYLGKPSLRDVIIASDCIIIDMETIHTLEHTADKKHIFICEGGQHIKDVEMLLFRTRNIEGKYKKLFALGGGNSALDYDNKAIKIKELFNYLPVNLDDLFEKPLDCLDKDTLLDASHLNQDINRLLEVPQKPFFTTDNQISVCLGLVGLGVVSLGSYLAYRILKSWRRS